MPVTVTKTVKPSGGDYTSLSAWEAGQQGNLVTLDEIQEAECYAFEDTTAVTIDGWTTDATRFLKVTVPLTERHDGKRNTAKYRLHATVNFGVGCLTCNENNARLEGLQVKNTGTVDTYGIEISSSTSGDDIRLSDVLVYDCTTAGSVGFSLGGNEIRLSNCVAINCGVGFRVAATGSDVSWAYNCVAVNNATHGFQVTGFRTLHCKNCYAGGSGTNDYQTDTNGTLNKTTSHSEDATGNTTTAFSTSSGAYFTNVTAGSEDVHIGTSSALKDAGTDLSGDAQWVHPLGNVDIDGDARPAAAWDVGADEFAVAAAAGPLPSWPRVRFNG